MSGLGRTLKGYVFWTYPRGSFHYDVMVTLILAFIFLSPRVFHYQDQPKQSAAQTGVLVEASGTGGLLYQLPAEQVGAPAAGETLEGALLRAIEPVSGKVAIDRYEVAKDAAGRKTYKVWAHR